MNNHRHIIKSINLFLFVGLVLCSSNSLATDIFTAHSTDLWELGKKTLTSLSLHLDYTDRNNKYVPQAQKRSMDWIEKWKIITNPEILKKIDSSNFAGLIGKAHPDATEDQLTIVVLFCSWLFIYDDVIEKELNKETVRGLHERSLEIINGANFDETKDSPLNKGLNEIIVMMQKEFNPSPLWKLRFSRDVNDYFKATVWELKNRKKKRFPTLEDYRTNRPQTGATKPMFDFMELIDKNEIPEEIFESPYFKALRSHAADLIDWENDIGSLFKEKINQDFHNLVIVYMANKNSKYEKPLKFYEEAFNFVAQALLIDLAEFKILSEEIPADMKPHEKAVRTYLNGLWQWIAANHFWAAESARYNPPEYVNKS